MITTTESQLGSVVTVLPTQEQHDNALQAVKIGIHTLTKPADETS